MQPTSLHVTRTSTTSAEIMAGGLNRTTVSAYFAMIPRVSGYQVYTSFANLRTQAEVARSDDRISLTQPAADQEVGLRPRTRSHVRASMHAHAPSRCAVLCGALTGWLARYAMRAMSAKL